MTVCLDDAYVCIRLEVLIENGALEDLNFNIDVKHEVLSCFENF